MFTLNCRGKLLSLQRPLVMGILNITGDSFYTASRHRTGEGLLQTAAAMLDAGAAILDIGGQSTRPGAGMLSAEEEAAAVIPAISSIHRAFPEAVLSVDTFYASVAAKAVAAGASIVNDISAGAIDPGMFAVVAELKIPYVLMHMQGRPDTMQHHPVYSDLILEILDFFIEKMAALRAAGVTDIIIDPGFGFGKTHPHNFALLKELHRFSVLDCPLLLGLSRKGTIYRTLGITAEQALNGTTVLNTIGLMNGAGILRVHDVKEAAEAVLLTEQCR
ncbi:dihydropteroate synthase [Niabella beijingensis]|uniref:dihydropteroate synthase n=1 Tax=Niabella beijingensis TaxID=2872700 RepID=UPI001CC031C1|nr:dihydropteroate synthase [Niabella beijingensis]MBZ4191248.1 dihydropteroate synthase [Niabella beijingensis]